MDSPKLSFIDTMRNGVFQWDDQWFYWTDYILPLTHAYACGELTIKYIIYIYIYIYLVDNMLVEQLSQWFCFLEGQINQLRTPVWSSWILVACLAENHSRDLPAGFAATPPTRMDIKSSRQTSLEPRSTSAETDIYSFFRSTLLVH